MDTETKPLRVVRHDGAWLAPKESPKWFDLTPERIVSLSRRTGHTPEGLQAALLACEIVSTTFYNYSLLKGDA